MEELYTETGANSGRVGTGRDGTGRVRTGRVGSGRVGSGRDGSGRDGSGRVESDRITLPSLPSFQTPLTPKVTSGASTITCYTKYSPPAQHAG